MAIAPVNKFLSVAVPIAPGEQKLYEVPTGTSAILLYAQVSNVGIGTYPTITFIHRRESRATGLRRDIRIIKDIDIPPNDAVVLIDGRLILEKTAVTLDRLFITGTQTGVTTVTNVTYAEGVGVATVTTMGLHGFSPNDQVTLAGIAFTCPSGSGITTTIFPDPQASYVVTGIADTVGTSKTFTATVGSANGITHTYAPATHTFVRADANCVSANTGGTFTPSAATYNPVNGDLVLTMKGHSLVTNVTNHTAQGGSGTGINSSTSYNPTTGILSIHINSHGFNANDLIKIDDGAVTFSCPFGGASGEAAKKAYPRSTDPISGKWMSIAAIPNANHIDVQVLDTVPSTNTNAHAFHAADAVTNGIKRAQNSIAIANNSLYFTCTQDRNATEHSYPRPTDPVSGQNIQITAATTDTLTVNVGITSAGGLVAPLQMEFIGSILENSST